MSRQDLEDWGHVTWTRMDPRISSKDITDRMGVEPNSNAIRISKKRLRSQNSTIQMRTARFRDDFPALEWVKKGGNFEKDRRKLKTRREAANIPLSKNTTRGAAWGLFDRAKGESGGRIAVAQTESWPSSVGRQPEVLPNLPTSLSVAAAKLLSVFTTNKLCSSPRSSFTWSDSHHSRAPTPDHHFRMSSSGSVGDWSMKRESDSSFEIIMEAPRSDRKRQKTKKFEAASCALTPTNELSFCAPQGPVQVSTKDPYQSAYVRSQKLRDRFGVCTEWKPQQRELPNDLLKVSSNHPNTTAISSHLASKEAFAHKLQYLTARYAAKKAIENQLVQNEANKCRNDGRVTIEYGTATLNLKNYTQRCYPSQEAREILGTFHPAGSKERNLQLEYLLDPLRAPFGFQDCNGYTPPVAGVNLACAYEYNIWYQITPEEAAGRIKTTIR
jgi:hypothetical protein